MQFSFVDLPENGVDLPEIDKPLTIKSCMALFFQSIAIWHSAHINQLPPDWPVVSGLGHTMLV